MQNTQYTYDISLVYNKLSFAKYLEIIFINLRIYASIIYTLYIILKNMNLRKYAHTLTEKQIYRNQQSVI